MSGYREGLALALEQAVRHEQGALTAKHQQDARCQAAEDQLTALRAYQEEYLAMLSQPEPRMATPDWLRNGQAFLSQLGTAVAMQAAQCTALEKERQACADRWRDAVQRRKGIEAVLAERKRIERRREARREQRSLDDWSQRSQAACPLTK
ncbi:MAG: flagellar FliJ family protein [Pseudomonadota bacterium]|nr:flagellar FliJ family protein [Pseudomonadota bacterium]